MFRSGPGVGAQVANYSYSVSWTAKKGGSSSRTASRRTAIVGRYSAADSDLANGTYLRCSRGTLAATGDPPDTSAMTTPEPSPYRITLQNLEADARVKDEDLIEEQDASAAPVAYGGDGDVFGHPGVHNRP